MNDRLFVYGTLMSGFKNEFSKILHQFTLRSIPAKIRGCLYIQTNWTFPYPVADYLPNSNHCIFGELLFLNSKKELVDLYNLLDEYEGVDRLNPENGEYVRKVVTVFCKDSQEEAWCYVNNKYPINLQRIPQGDFREYCKTIK